METNIKQFALHELPQKETDYSFEQSFGSLSHADLPTEDFLVAVPLEIKDQDINYPSDFCAAYSASELAELEDQVIFVPEYTFAYAKWKQAQVEGPDAIKSFGLNLRQVCDAAINCGFLPRSLDPFKCNTPERPPRDFIADFYNWPEELSDIAKKYKKAGYFKADGHHDTFDNFRSVLWMNIVERRAIITGALWRQSWLTAPNGIIPKKYEAGGTPHAFIFIGQKTINNEIHLVAQLSSNKKVGDNGLFYFPREVVNKEIGPYGAFTLKDLPPYDPSDPKGVSLSNMNKWNPLWIFRVIAGLFK